MNTLSVYTQDLTARQLLQLQYFLQTISHDSQFIKKFDGRHIEIPVRYGGGYGPDLLDLAQQKNMTVRELVERHTAPIYTVYFMGFQPGFPYLGGLSPELYSPRHAVPRLQVPAGSVGIGGEQTGIYPFASPGGWQLLGRTELPLFNLKNEQPTLLQAGDTLSFVAIDVIEERL
jgi:KipI family sensor histidine kinase inhibitor